MKHGLRTSSLSMLSSEGDRCSVSVPVRPLRRSDCSSNSSQYNQNRRGQYINVAHVLPLHTPHSRRGTGSAELQRNSLDNGQSGTVMTTYDPLSNTRNGRVGYDAAVAQAVVNTAQQLDQVRRLRRLTSSSPASDAEAALLDYQRGDNNRSASQFTVGVSSSSFPAAATIAPQKRNSAPGGPKPFTLTEEPPLLLVCQTEHINRSGPVLVPTDPRQSVIRRERSPQFDGVSSIRSSAHNSNDGVYPRRSTEPVVWQPERTLPCLARDRGTSHQRTASGRRRSNWREEGGVPSFDGPTLHHKQLTEAFYGNYSGGLLAQEAYLYFMAEMNRQHGNRSGNYSRWQRLQRQHSAARHRRSHPSGLHRFERSEGSVYPEYTPPQSKCV